MNLRLPSSPSCFRHRAKSPPPRRREKAVLRQISIISGLSAAPAFWNQRHRWQHSWSIGPLLVHLLSCSVVLGAYAGDANDDAFFESKVRPLLLKRCLEFHGSEKPKGGLRLDSRAGWEAGGEHGPPIVPGKPEASLLIKAVRYARLGPVVPRRLPAFFGGTSQAAITKGSGRRELAAWIASPSNPLTARVIVNRLWQWHFGEGLVRTPNNFGLLAEPPTHPDLLDWLATQFIADGWSLKKLHRRLLLSEAYQRSSAAPPPQVARDPENRWRARFSARRLEAEAIRDAMLYVSGKLDPSPGGPAGAEVSAPCRSLYIQTARWDRSNFATLFDAANPDASVEKRLTSTVAPQALFLLNHDFVHTQAALLARRLLQEAGDAEAARIEHAYQLLFARPPRAEELHIGRHLIAQSGGTTREAAWHEFAQVLLCSNEFIYVD